MKNIVKNPMLRRAFEVILQSTVVGFSENPTFSNLCCWCGTYPIEVFYFDGTKKVLNYADYPIAGPNGERHISVAGAYGFRRISTESDQEEDSPILIYLVKEKNGGGFTALNGTIFVNPEPGIFWNGTNIIN